MRELFIYWRVAADRAGAALSATAAFQATQRMRHAGLRTALYKRDGDAGSAAVTVMETYALPAAASGIDAALQLALTTAADGALGSWCQDRRHVEAFDAVTPQR